jgi:hypothetical protein
VVTNKAEPQPKDESQLAYAEELRAFLASGEQKVLLIHGLWGIGKTYFWRRFVNDNRGAIRETFYSYVSLFGSSSVSHIKGLVMFGGEAVRDPKTVGDVLTRGRNWLASKRRYFEAVSLPHIANLGAAVAAFEELLIKDYLVCFDDLERRNKALDLEQFFGFVSVLKEQNDCRVVIICNEEELSPRDRRILSKYREKIIDRQITYNPSFAENFRLIFPSNEIAIREVFRNLGLNNIRVFQQTLWCMRYFKPYLKDCHEAVVEQFLQQCAKLAAVHYGLSKHLTVEQVRLTSWLLVAGSDDDKVKTKSNELIKRLEFSPTEADDLIVEFLRNGYCGVSELKAVIEGLNQNYKRSEAEKELRRVWGLVWDNYRANSAEFLTETKQFFAKHYQFLPFDYTKQLLDFVHKIEPSFEVAQMEQQAAEHAISTADAQVLQTIEKLCTSPTIKTAIEARRQTLKPKKSIETLIGVLAEPGGWNPSDFCLLNEYSEEELLDWLSQADEPRLLLAIAEIVARGQHQSADNKSGAEVGRKFRSVLEKLAKRSPLDASRTESLFERLRRRLPESLDLYPPLPTPTQNIAENASR